MALDVKKAPEDEVGAQAAGRGVQRTVRRVALRSVLKFALLFAGTASLIILLAGGVLYMVASVSGLAGQIETWVRHAGYPAFRFHSATVFGILLGVTVVGSIVVTAGLTLATFVFNLVSEAVGGIEVTFYE